MNTKSNGYPLSDTMRFALSTNHGRWYNLLWPSLFSPLPSPKYGPSSSHLNASFHSALRMAYLAAGSLPERYLPSFTNSCVSHCREWSNLPCAIVHASHPPTHHTSTPTTSNFSPSSLNGSFPNVMQFPLTPRSSTPSSHSPYRPSPPPTLRYDASQKMR